MYINRAMRSVFELGAGDLVSRLETKNLVTFSEVRGGSSREVEESLPLCMFLFILVSLVCCFSINGEFHLYLGF